MVRPFKRPPKCPNFCGHRNQLVRGIFRVLPPGPGKPDRECLFHLTATKGSPRDHYDDGLCGLFHGLYEATGQLGLCLGKSMPGSGGVLHVPWSRPRHLRPVLGNAIPSIACPVSIPSRIRARGKVRDSSRGLTSTCLPRGFSFSHAQAGPAARPKLLPREFPPQPELAPNEHPTTSPETGKWMFRKARTTFFGLSGGFRIAAELPRRQNKLVRHQNRLDRHENKLAGTALVLAKVPAPTGGFSSPFRISAVVRRASFFPIFAKLKEKSLQR